ncbi:uncharacterized protein PHALS_02512 [Plasmopara halstedii]|uniref:Uncharacterized protein n=1 Tax=Plasmopara halstedii TaxID=4781 RepID=A0A0P1A7L3_PLAHL|nr:uncharacterized protein PHALS_02512 [Plasmopara halstedii]CEG36412.1 hypothetical protein PHALS_02512 [Plasmopara halstedii]|eukprot:XP_024572781.1 hypothetical protein PHALS_02512 [Plasmopara halstedii]
MKLPLLANESKGWRKLSLTGFSKLPREKKQILNSLIQLYSVKLVDNLGHMSMNTTCKPVTVSSLSYYNNLPGIYTALSGM